MNEANYSECPLKQYYVYGNEYMRIAMDSKKWWYWLCLWRDSSV